MVEVVVTGIGLASALGQLEQTWKGLVENRSGVRLHQPFLAVDQRPIALISEEPATLTSLTQQVLWDALKDAQLEPPLETCAVVVGSSRGHQAQWERMAAGQQSVSNWLNTLPNGVSIAVAQAIETQSIVLAPMAACATGLWTIARATELIRSGEVDRVIAGSVETPITPLTLIGFERMGALAKTGVYPFDRTREGLVLGEGGALLVLETEELAKQRNAKIYGRVLGFGLTADGYHVSAPEPGSRTAIAAVLQCLQRSELQASEIDYIHAHGTATQLNDRNEAFLIEQLFGRSVPVSSTKGATGHTLGASGALGAAFTLMSLDQQQLVPNVGLRECEFDGLNVVTEARSAEIRQALCFSFGFGGQNAAIAFAQAR